MQQRNSGNRLRIGLAVVAIAILLGSFAYVFVDRRPTSPLARAALCRSSIHQVTVAGTELKIPGAPPFSIYLYDDLNRGVFHLQIPDDAKRLCEQNDFGDKTLAAHSISITYADIFNIWTAARVACTENRFGWSKEICEIVQRVNAGHAKDSDFPTNLTVFATDPEGSAPKGHDLLSSSTYLESREGKPTSRERRGEYDRRTFTYHPFAARLTPDGNPLTARCEPSYANSSRCRATYRWNGLTHIDVNFVATDGDLERKLFVVQEKAHHLLNQLR